YLAEVAPQVQVVLTGRGSFDPSVLAVSVAERARIHYLRCDVANPAQCRQLIEQIQTRFGKLNGIFHVAGNLRDSLLRNKQPEQLAEVLAPKVQGLVALDQATIHLTLDFILCFSSISGVFGGSGQTDYAMANAFMDEFAHWRNRQQEQGLRQGRTLSIAWPLWKDGGMQANALQQQLLASFGMQALPVTIGLAALQNILQSGRSYTLVLHGNRQSLERSLQQFNQ